MPEPIPVAPFFFSYAFAAWARQSVPNVSFSAAWARPVQRPTMTRARQAARAAGENFDMAGEYNALSGL